jgi:toxin HigB-1
VIVSFRSNDTEKLWSGTRVKQFSAFERVAQRKLAMLNAAPTLDDLRVPPGNRLEKLVGDREGQHSIRINDQWRLCFEWKDGAHNVEIVDYH